jgi:lysophospholipase L1-like esterase
MAQMARAAGLEVILSQLPPITLNGVSFNPQVIAANAAIHTLAIENGYLVVDYFSPMAGHPEYFVDGEHPNAAGYAVMEAALAATVSR